MADCSGHQRYGAFFFRHHDLSQTKNLDSFKHRVNRIRQLKQDSESNILFVYAAVAEHTPRLDMTWKADEAFSMGNHPFAAYYKDEAEIQKLYGTLQSHFKRFKLLVIINDWETIEAGGEPYFKRDPVKSSQNNHASLDFYNLYTLTRNWHCLAYSNQKDQSSFEQIIKLYK